MHKFKFAKPIRQNLLYLIMTNDVVIVGGGIVGLATAYQLIEKNPRLRITVIEKEDRVAAHQTGHNSGVIHSGLYYKPGSLKATNCINGYHQLIQFCETHEVPYELCGKIVVATRENQLPILAGLHERGIQNKLDGIRKLTVEQMREIEPHVAGLAGLWVPQTGIIDYTVVCQKLEQLILEKGAKIHFNEHGQVEALFTNLSPEQETQLIQCTFGRADAWLNWQEDQTRDRALGGLKDVFAKGMIGYVRLFAWMKDGAVYFGNRLMGNKARHEKWEN